MTQTKILTLALGIVSILFGLWLVRAPKKAIEFQVRFYGRINWRMEPLDWNKEIRNTRVMGWATLLFGLAALFLGR